jgi:hypothetical protein
MDTIYRFLKKFGLEHFDPRNVREEEISALKKRKEKKRK